MSGAGNKLEVKKCFPHFLRHFPGPTVVLVLLRKHILAACGCMLSTVIWSPKDAVIGHASLSLLLNTISK